MAKKAVAKKKAPAKKAAVKKAPAKKAPAKKVAQKKSAINSSDVDTFFVSMTRTYIGFEDLFDGLHFDEAFLANTKFDYEELKEDFIYGFLYESADEVIENGSIVILLEEKVQVHAYGKCKCGHRFDEVNFGESRFCSECGAKRGQSPTASFTSLPEDYKRVIKGDPKKFPLRWTLLVEDHVKRLGGSRFLSQSAVVERVLKIADTTFDELQAVLPNESIWESENCEEGAESTWASWVGNCSKCSEPFKPLEKFCALCGNKQPWFNKGYPVTSPE